MPKIVSYIYQSGYFRDVFIIPADTNKTVHSLTVGFYLAIFPVPGTVTLLCILVSFIFRLNLVLLQGMNWLLTPLQIALIYPFLKTGRLLFFSNSKVLPFVWPESLPAAGNAETFYHIAESLVGGILVWGIVSLTTGYFLFRLLLKIIPKINHSKHSQSI
jgi:uncharacterized protein (DUF2062 family)